MAARNPQVSGDEVGAAFIHAAELVKAWGEYRLPDGQSVRGALTFGGLSYWDAIAPMLAFVHISRALGTQLPRSRCLDGLRLVAKRIKGLGLDVGQSLVAARTAHSPWPGNGAYLFLGFSPYIYRETLQPIAERIARHAGSSAVSVDDSLALRPRRTVQATQSEESIWSHWEPTVASDARVIRRALRVAGRRLLAPDGLPRVVTDGGLAWGQVRGVFDWLFSAYLVRLVAYGVVARHVIEKHRPALIVSPDVNDPRGRLFCLGGRLSGVKTLEVQFGFYGPNDIEWRFFIADHLAVTGKKNLQVMTGHGVPEAKMTVTGSPRYDPFASSAHSRATIRHGEQGVVSRPVKVLFASQPFFYGSFKDAEIRREMIGALFRSVARLRNVALLVKPHPMEDQAELQQLGGSGHNIRLAERHADIRGLLAECDVFVTFFSSTTFDALVLGKPTLNLSFPGANSNTLFDECGATFVARSEGEIAEFMQKVDSGRIAGELEARTASRDQFLGDWFFRLDGRASERIEALATEMAVQKTATPVAGAEAAA